ncbi:short-chain dehydrogenase [Chitinimonas prasina]|uniref:Short-chain dehydrogenase n=1 Tax=Chitinimonas prasina TaxID=1434937 RepID=A0ABQ5YH88_9NEIS|nr:SDR family oxidoreductase [Chitinimonas prasina]GLR14370.1 short-chain dehydrogenase [Chitinimonas prasina]
MDNIKGKWALVTGASSGFGMDFATALAERGANLILTARRTEPMEKLAASLRALHGIEVVVEAADLAAPGAGTALKAQLDCHGLAVDVLINNAGFGVYGQFVDQPLGKTLEMLQLNVVSLTELTHVFAADMVKRGGGHILLVASIGGYQATPTYAAYAASKAYVLLFGEALHTELAPSKVKVSVLSPGVTATSFLAVSGQQTTPYQRLLMMQSRPVVDIGLKALFNGTASVIPGVGNKLTIFSNRFAPRSLQSRVAYQLMKN